MLKGRILGVDFGQKRIGLAVSDPLQIIASALENLEAKNSLKASSEALNAHIKTLGYPIVAIVIGLPLNMNGTESDRSKIVREFAKLVEEESHLPVHLVDERLSSVQAERSLMEIGYSRKKRAKVVDRVSAVIVLQTYLSQKAG